jgi:2,4-didehydro-3-deoxy-L-rhamnonate hydrolase
MMEPGWMQPPYDVAPGDVINTGTTAGVGLGMKPPQYLKPGDIVELGIEGLRDSRQ